MALERSGNPESDKMETGKGHGEDSKPIADPIDLLKQARDLLKDKVGDFTDLILHGADTLAAKQLCAAQNDHKRFVITIKYFFASREVPGPFHGYDPNYEFHDPDLPANQQGGIGFPSSDPFNGSLGNDRNHPYRPY